ncbi:hypothetical protein [Halorarius halobius]|uniref:hypothetical protein n=1 Tax=Halorarius halobius TaxID=2962671 RepID=UPI0020CE4952|nr:hypothetical protein [Halorarius halobius]
MADVSRDRAQLLIVGGLALAVTLVALAIILNSAIYTGNLATRESNHDTRAVVEHEATVNQSLGRAIRFSNTENPAAPEKNFSEEVVVINDRLREQTRNGVITHVSASVTDKGTRMAQLDDTRGFSAGGGTGETDWTLVDDLESTRTYRMRLDKTTLFDADSLFDTRSTITSTAFTVVVTDSGGDTWEVYIYQSSVTGNAYLMTNDPDDSFLGADTLLTVLDGSCAAAGPEVVVDFKTGTFGPAPDVRFPHGVAPMATTPNTRCSELSWYDPSESYDVRYENTEDGGGVPTVQGKWELVVSKDYGGLDTSQFYDPGDGHPFAHAAITEVQTTMSFRTPEVTYRTQWTALSRQERIFRGVAPDIEAFTVTEEDSADFDADWEVSDDDDDLRKVTVTLYDLTDGEQDDQATYTVTGESASGTADLNSDEGSDGNEYEIRIRVRDSQGHVTFDEEERTT